MKGNSILNTAKHNNNTDEWYTDYKTVSEEVSRYKIHFKNKSVLCNCDNPYKSAFVLFFLRNFNEFSLKKLVCTSYEGKKKYSKEGIIEKNNADEAYVMEVTKIGKKKTGVLSNTEVDNFLQKTNVIKKLSGDGDFLSDECIKYLKNADIVCTNPPFSKFVDMFSLLMKYEKKFLLIGNQNAITYKEIFPEIIKGNVWLGYKFGDMAFKVPKETLPRKTRFWIDGNGQKWRSLGNAMWLTNIENNRIYNDLKLTEAYSPLKYEKYDNFDAIHILSVKDIPFDYEGIMGVPITFLKYHNNKQFEIVGEANHGSDNEYDLFKPKIAGNEKFKRILIRKRK